MSEIPKNPDNEKLDKMISNNDRFRLYFNHTTGISSKKRLNPVKNFYIGRLKESSYKILSYYYKTTKETQYLLVALFEHDTDVEIFDTIFHILTERVSNKLDELDYTNKKVQELNKLEKEIQNDIKYAVFQIDRLSRLEKIQKVALIFSSFERIEILRILREGPISRSVLNEKILTIKHKANLDLLLKPFIELNLVRRDWVRGVWDKKTGEMLNQGEYIFLVKDIALIRKPPSYLVEKMKTNRLVGPKYMKIIKEYYKNYQPFEFSLQEQTIEYQTLSRFLLDPDVFDFLNLLKSQIYPLKKLPNVLSSFANTDEVLDQLIKSQIIKIVSDISEMEWICMIAEIHPLIVFPEYLINKISDRAAVSLKSIKNDSLFSPLSPELGKIALELLEATYSETIEF
ncbi:MAG: hypothetical protein ACTSWL_04795 [Promethearchaeota archaeon]